MSSSLNVSGEEESKKKLEFCEVDMPSSSSQIKVLAVYKSLILLIIYSSYCYCYYCYKLLKYKYKPRRSTEAQSSEEGLESPTTTYNHYLEHYNSHAVAVSQTRHCRRQANHDVLMDVFLGAKGLGRIERKDKANKILVKSEENYTSAIVKIYADEFPSHRRQ